MQNENMLLKYRRFIIDLNVETARGAAIVSCAYLDDSLNELLKAKLVYNKDLFKNYIDRLTFDRRITLSYLIGLISKRTRIDLKTLNKIRSEFAHDKTLNSFNRKTDKIDIPLLLDGLHTIKDAKKEEKSFSHNRDKFIYATSFYLGLFDYLLKDCERIKEIKHLFK